MKLKSMLTCLLLGILALMAGTSADAFADDSVPVTTPGAPTGTSSAPAPKSGGHVTAAAIACNYEEFCISKDINFNNSTYKFMSANANWSFTSYANLYNEDSSWRSRWTVPVVVYDLTSYAGGQTICVNVNWDVYYASGANDRGSSHKWDGRGAC